MRRRSLAVTMVLAAVSLGMIAPQVATSAPSQNPRAEREQVRAERARVAAQIDTSKASQAQIDTALQAINGNLRSQEAALARTEAEVAQAKQDIEDAQAAIGRLTKEVSTLKEQMRLRAIQAFVSPPGDDVLTVLQTKDFTTAANRKFYIELRAQDDADISDRLQGATSDLEHQRKKATEAKKLAETKQAEQARRTETVRAARADQKRLADNIEATIDSQISRSLELAKTDRALSVKIAQQQAALAARLASLKAAKAAASARDRAAAAARAAAQSNQRPSGGESGPLPPISGGGPSGGGGSGVGICSVSGISGGVNCQVESQVVAMLNAARADGVNLSGGGFRSSASQISLRQAHCGSSYYAIYQMSSSSCRPPTARPGSSQHEIGLAIDFSSCSRGSACFNWLRANASRFGFYNLPSESWHWSTTGS
ncbi:MAG: D-alanyl-D-alanine carboxypeptidase family protein [Aquihabitans sp.]